MNKTKNIKYLKLILVFFIISNYSNLFSQKINNQLIDSVLQNIKKQDTSSTYKNLSILGTQIVKEPPNKATKHFEYLFQKDSSAIVKLIINEFYANKLIQIGQTAKPLKLRLEGLELAKTFNKTTSFIYYNLSLASSYSFNNNLDKALKHLNIAERKALDIKSSFFLDDIYLEKANIYYSLKDNKKVIEYSYKVWDLIKNEKNTLNKRYILYAIVSLQTNFDSPLDLAFFTEKLALLYQGDNEDIPKGHVALKDIFDKQVNPKYISRYEEYVRVSDSINSPFFYYYSTLLLTNSYLINKQPKKAIEYYKKAEEKLKQIGWSKQLMDIYFNLSNTYVSINDYKLAYKYNELGYELKNSFSIDKMKKNIIETEIKYDSERKEREILEQKSIIKKKENQKNKIIISTVAIGLILIISILFYRKKLKLQKVLSIQNNAIQKQRITQLNQKNKLLALNSMVEGQEAERLRIAKDLHDSLGGLLSSVKDHFTIIQSENSQLKKIKIINKTKKLIDEACNEVRRISHNMIPHALNISGLQGAIEDLAEQLNEQNFKTIVEIHNLPKNLEETKKIMIYRLIQEIISNIKKHSFAKTILIQVLCYENEINLIIEDDGVGFNYHNAINNGGMGLKSINSRIDYLEGIIDWDSQANNGTTITINIPT
ncbi:MAG: histidine kinase [Flavobacteriaceae bacterium]